MTNDDLLTQIDQRLQIIAKQSEGGAESWVKYLVSSLGAILLMMCTLFIDHVNEPYHSGVQGYVISLVSSNEKERSDLQDIGFQKMDARLDKAQQDLATIKEQIKGLRDQLDQLKSKSP